MFVLAVAAAFGSVPLSSAAFTTIDELGDFITLVSHCAAEAP